MLNSFEIKNLLTQQIKLKPIKNNKRITGFETGSGERLYIKTSAEPSAKPVHKNPLIIHPKMQAMTDQINAIHGVSVDWSTYIHNSNLKGFPLREHTGKNPIEYGLAVGIESVQSLTELLQIIDPRAFRSEKNLLDEITDHLSDLPDDKTTRKAIVDARIGQGTFRLDLISAWGRCAVTNTTTLEMLKASHIKPWRDANNTERLDKFNGLLLSANLDAAFDSGLISFEDNGKILISTTFSEANQFSITPEMTLKHVFEENKPYLAYHRTNVFQGTP